LVADHIAPHRGDYQLFRLSELRSLCKGLQTGLRRHRVEAARLDISVLPI
jgi:hypothetical protein